MKTVWKGSTIAGPQTPGAALPEFRQTPDDQTLDALSGHYRIFQYKKGHRYSTDDLLVAWFGTSHGPSARTVLDLGSGVGSVALIAAWRLQGARFVTVEAQDISVALARKSARYNGLEGRFDIRLGDFRDEGVLKSDERFDLVLGSPPYFALDAGLQGDHDQKVACRFEVRGTIADYCLAAARHLAPGGMFATVFPVQPQFQLDRVVESARAAKLTILRARNVRLKEDEPPLLGLFLMIATEDLPKAFQLPAPVWTDPDLVIRRSDGTIHPEYSVVKMAIGFPP